MPPSVLVEQFLPLEATIDFNFSAYKAVWHVQFVTKRELPSTVLLKMINISKLPTKSEHLFNAAITTEAAVCALAKRAVAMTSMEKK